MTGDCPTPAKLWFYSRAEAMTGRRRFGGAHLKGQLRPYRCDCGGWHLTSLKHNQSRRARQKTKKDAAT